MPASVPRVLVAAGYGLNCEDETLFAFTLAGGAGDIIHVNDLIAAPERVRDYQILAIPGGFSYGDDTGSGNALACRLRHNLWEELCRFMEGDRLTIGICNGCQTLVNLGLVPAIGGEIGVRQVALLHNASFRYQCRWVDVRTETASPCVWTRGLTQLHIPVAHGEGMFATPEETLAALESGGHVALRYVRADGSAAQGVFPANPNGSLADIAALTDSSGRVLALMPHPERGLFFTQREDWHRLAAEAGAEGDSLPEYGDGMALFRNGVEYFQ